MAELLANNASTTLNGGINNSTTSVVVTSATGFPVTGDFRIIIGSEIMLVTGVAGNTFTVTRGVESTGAASHLNGAQVTHVLTVGGLTQFIDDNVTTGASIGAGVIGSRPAAGNTGNMYIPTSGNIFQRDNGASWDSYGPIYKFTQPPAASSFTGIVQSGVTLTDQGGSLLLTSPYVAAESRSAFYIAQTSTWEVTAAFKFYCDSHDASSTPEVGLGFINIASGQWRYAGWKAVGSANVIFNIYYDNNAHTSASTAVSTPWVNNTGGIIPNGGLFWVKIEYQATNRVFSMSFDGVNFQQVYSETKNNVFTPDAAAIIVSSKGTTANTNMGGNLLVNIWDWH